MTSKRDITRAVTKQSKAIAKLPPDTTQAGVMVAIGAATATLWEGWFCPFEDVPSLCPADLERRVKVYIRIVQSAPAWGDSVLHDRLGPGAASSMVWVALRNCLRQAVADLGYDLHAEYPLSKVERHDRLTGRWMSPEKFGKQCKAAFEADPIGDLVHNLREWGLSESQLMNLLKTQPALPDPFRIAVHNKYRTFHLTNP
jgi:hypothetical protein